MKRVMIIGKSGAGKSVFADKLGKALRRDVIHLDKLYWKADWTRVYKKAEWREKIASLVSQDEWIIDGNYRSTIPVRLERADTVIFFDTNRFICLFNAWKRTRHKNRLVQDKVEGQKEAISWELIWLTLTYPSQTMKELLFSQKGKKIYILKSHKDAERLLSELQSKKYNLFN